MDSSDLAWNTNIPNSTSDAFFSPLQTSRVFFFFIKPQLWKLPHEKQSNPTVEPLSLYCLYCTQSRDSGRNNPPLSGKRHPFSRLGIGVLIHSYSADESKTRGGRESVRDHFSQFVAGRGMAEDFFSHRRAATQRLRGSQLEGLSRPFKRQIMFLFS